jgi:hypothetical protein
MTTRPAVAMRPLVSQHKLTRESGGCYGPDNGAPAALAQRGFPSRPCRAHGNRGVLLVVSGNLLTIRRKSPSSYLA